MESADQSAKRVLLVDDDLDDRELFVEAFSYLDGSIIISTLETSDNLMDHLIHLDQLPDYLFLDLNMPRKNGKECLKDLQKHDQLKNMRVVIYTTSINPKDVAETFADGAYCFIQKPNSFSDLKDVLQKVITSHVSSYSLSDGFVFSGRQ